VTDASRRPSGPRWEAAQAALTDLVARPRDVVTAMDSLLADDARDPAAVVALRARALAAKLLGRLEPAVADLRRAVELGRSLGEGHLVAEARMSLVVMLADSGRPDAALVEAVEASATLSGLDAARMGAQQGLVLQRAGRHEEALEAYRRALPVLRRHGDTVWEARLLGNRGALHAYLGNTRAAVRDLQRCIDLAREDDHPAQLALALQNLGFAHGRAGDVPRALELFDESRRLKDELGLSQASALLDRAEALIAAGLASEAEQAARGALAELSERGFALDASEARLLVARAALQAGNAPAAQAAALRAAKELTAQRRGAWARLARHVAILAQWESGPHDAALLRGAERSSAELAEAGWNAEATASLLVAARTALELGRRRRAAELLGRVAVRRRRSSAEEGMLGWHAEALRCLQAGERAAASRAAEQGLRVHEQAVAAYGSTDLRAGASVRCEELAVLGLQIALEAAQPRRVLVWSERWRAGWLRQPPVRPPRDAELAGDLTELRRVVSRAREEALAGRSVAALEGRRIELERRIRDRLRHARGRYAPARPLDVSALAGELDDRALVEFVRVRDQLHVVTLVAGRARLRRLCGYPEVTRELDSLRLALNRIARGAGTVALLEHATATRRYAAEALDTALLEPVRRAVGERELVIVPTGALHALPWSVLPSCADRPVTVAPSAHAWLTAMRRPAAPASARTVLAAGPGLEHGAGELDALRVLHPGAQVLDGPAATAEAVRDAMDGAGLAHVIAHGRFRSDNPLFSCLELADGPLTVYDLERMRRAPMRLVLSACDSALSDVRPGDELMGLSAAVLALGTRTLVASVALVDDEGSRKLMEAFHHRLVSGTAPARALAEATSSSGVDGFVCFGAG
jgi:tetratricopeptide (TPR) repeat protein